MQHQQYNLWFDHHKVIFPGLTNWMTDNPGQRLAWEKSLEPVPYEVAMCATDALFVEEESKPYGDHCRYIRAYWSSKQGTESRTRWGPEYRHGEYIASCPHCMDTGYVSVANPHSLQKAWRYDPATDEPKFTIQPCAMACECSRGQVIAEGHKKNTKRPIGQWNRESAKRHPLFCLDGPDGIVNLAALACESNAFPDFLQAERTILHEKLHAFHNQRLQTPYEFPGYEP